ncbi:unnamed protein product, partial [Amoebophrya sp. A25]
LAFSAVRFLGVCRDIPRLVEISQREHWADRDDGMCAVALALVGDAGITISDILAICGDYGLSLPTTTNTSSTSEKSPSKTASSDATLAKNGLVVPNADYSSSKRNSRAPTTLSAETIKSI